MRRRFDSSCWHHALFPAQLAQSVEALPSEGSSSEFESPVAHQSISRLAQRQRPVPQKNAQSGFESPVGYHAPFAKRPKASVLQTDIPRFESSMEHQSTRGSIPTTWVTAYSGDIGNTFDRYREEGPDHGEHHESPQTVALGSDREPSSPGRPGSGLLTRGHGVRLLPGSSRTPSLIGRAAGS